MTNLSALAYPKFVAFVKQVFSLPLRTWRALLVAGLVLATLALLGLLGLPAGFRRVVLGRGKGSWLWLALQLLLPELGRALQLAANLGGLR